MIKYTVALLLGLVSAGSMQVPQDSTELLTVQFGQPIVEFLDDS